LAGARDYDFSRSEVRDVWCGSSAASDNPKSLTGKTLLVRIQLPQPEWPYSDFEDAIRDLEAAGTRVVRLGLGRGKLDLPGAERLLANAVLGELYGSRDVGTGVHLVLDLSECTFLDPFGVVAVRALCEAISARVDRIWFCVPRDVNVQSYFGVVGCTDGVREFVTVVGEVPGHAQPSDDSEVLLPLTTIDRKDDAAHAAQNARERLGSLLDRLGWEGEVADLTVSSIMEVAMNVVEHAHGRGSLAMQGYRLRSPEPYVVMAISDAGVGIRHTLEARFRELSAPSVSDGEVLQRMFQQSLSSRAERSGGRGMKVLRDTLLQLKGRLDIRSGRGKYSILPWSTGARTLPVWFPGTHIRLGIDGPRLTR
jgi:anti-sigma regulatory factor (Ser/Thr protein kinase)